MLTCIFFVLELFHFFLLTTWSQTICYEMFDIKYFHQSMKFFFSQNFYIPTSRQLKRIESVTRSPVYTHFSETISGGPTIRAYDASLRFMRESKARVDRNQSFYYISLAANRYFSSCMSCCSLHHHMRSLECFLF